MTSRRCVFRAARVPSSSTPINRLYPARRLRGWRPAAALCALQPCAPYLGDRNGSNSDIGRNPAVPLQIADATNWLSDVRFGSKADICAAKCHVRLTQKRTFAVQLGMSALGQ